MATATGKLAPLSSNGLIGTIVPLVMVVGYAVLSLQPDLRLAVPLLVGTTALLTTSLACSLYWGTRLRLPWSPSFILVVALLLRLMFVLAPAQLSDDINRYLWDGSNLLRGINPYAASPSAMTPPPELKAVHAQVNHPQYPTIYPPAAQLIFAAGATLGGGAAGLKAFLVLLDLLLCALLIRLLRELQMPVWQAALYAWNPLPVLEIASSGHVDGAGLTLLFGSLTLLLAARPSDAAAGSRCWPSFCSGGLLAAAGLVKLSPFVLAPVLFLLVPARRRPHFLAGFFLALAALIIPFLPQLGNMLHTLEAYARNWEFAGFLFTALRALTGSGTAARLLLSGSLLLVIFVIVLRLAATLKHLDAVPGAAKALSACYAIAMGLLLTTPTLQPWYALLLAALLPFCAGPAGLLLCWVVFLTYQVQIPYFILGAWIENQWVTAAVFLAPATAWLLGRAFSRLKSLEGEISLRGR